MLTQLTAFFIKIYVFYYISFTISDNSHNFQNKDDI